MRRGVAQGRIALVGPAADPDDPLDPITCHAGPLADAGEVLVFREGEAHAGVLADLEGARVLAFAGAPGDALAQAVARRVPSVVVLAGGDLLSSRIAQATARRALPALAAALAAEHPSLAAMPTSPGLRVLAGPLARQGAGAARILARQRAVVVHDPALVRGVASPPGGVHLAPRAIAAEVVRSVAARARPEGPPRLLAVGAPGAAREGFAVLRALAEAGPGLGLDLAGAAPAPGWALHGAAAALGLGGRVRWQHAGGRGPLVRLAAGAAGVVALDAAAGAAGAALIGRALGLPVLEGAEPAALHAFVARVAAAPGRAVPDAAVLAAHDAREAAPVLLRALGLVR